MAWAGRDACTGASGMRGTGTARRQADGQDPRGATQRTTPKALGHVGSAGAAEGAHGSDAAVAGAVVVIACIRDGAYAGRGRRARGDGKVASVSFDLRLDL